MSERTPTQEFVGVGGVGEWINAPDRVESVARLVARQDTAAKQTAIAQVVRQRHRPAVAERILTRARQIVREQRKGRPVAAHARRGR